MYNMHLEGLHLKLVLPEEAQKALGRNSLGVVPTHYPLKLVASGRRRARPKQCIELGLIYDRG